jgi:hypothetical protein
MELTINVTEQSKLSFILQLLQEFEYIEIINIKDENTKIPIEHKKLLDKRLSRIKSGETTFKNWDLIKKKYEKRVV